MSEFASQLPPSATVTERILEQIFWEEMQAIERDIANFLDPWKCRLDLLPYLAWELSVDDWDDSWAEETKRRVVANSLEVHAYKGTRYALDKSIESIRQDGLTITEYFEDRDNLRPGYFRVNLLARNSHVDENTTTQIRKAVNNSKNARSHLDRISITSQVDTPCKTSVLSRLGMVIRSGPLTLEIA